MPAHLQNVIFRSSALELFQKSVSKTLRFLYICRESSTNHPFFCKTNPIFTRPKTNLTPYNKRIYENFMPLRTMKNKPKTNPISENPKMNLTPYKKRDYVKYMTFGPQKTNPIQTQFENRQNMNLTPYPENSYTPPQAPGFMPGVLPRTQTVDPTPGPPIPPSLPVFPAVSQSF